MPSIGFLLNAAVKATAILAAVWLLTLTMRRRSAAARYFTWTCALGALLAVPAISPLLPQWNLAVKAPALAPAARAVSMVEAAPEAAPATPAASPPPT